MADVLLKHTASGHLALISADDPSLITAGPGYTIVTSPAAVAAYKTAQGNAEAVFDAQQVADGIADVAIYNNYATAKQAAHGKLVTLGLTSFEATVLTGYDPDDDFDGPGDGDGDGDN